jgi:hypothetical protein
MKVDVTSPSKTAQKMSRVPAAILVITQEDIRRSGTTNISDLLRMVPGLDVAQVTPSVRAVIGRGFNGQYSNMLLVLIDGRFNFYQDLFSGGPGATRLEKNPPPVHLLMPVLIANFASYTRLDADLAWQPLDKMSLGLVGQTLLQDVYKELLRLRLDGDTKPCPPECLCEAHLAVLNARDVIGSRRQCLGRTVRGFLVDFAGSSLGGITRYFFSFVGRGWEKNQGADSRRRIPGQGSLDFPFCLTRGLAFGETGWCGQFAGSVHSRRRPISGSAGGHGSRQSHRETGSFAFATLGIHKICRPARSSFSAGRKQAHSYVGVDLHNAPVLTVGETAGFLDAGGIIDFLLEDNKLRFEVNLDTAESADLKIGSRLLVLAQRVVGESHGKLRA